MELPFKPYILRPYLSRKIILRSLAGVGVVYLCIALFIFLTGPASLDKIEATLASQKIDISTDKSTETVEVAHHVDANITSETPDSASKTPAAPQTSYKDAQNTLLAAPFENMTEPAKDGKGLLPKISPRGLTPFHAYKRPFIRTSKPVISLAIRDFGLSKDRSILLLRKLPRDVSLIVSPYATHLRKWTQDARSAGHETWLYIPSQTQNYPMHDPGPLALTKSAGLQGSLNATKKSLASFTGYAGVAMDMDNTFLHSETILEESLGHIFQRGLGYFDLNSDAPAFFKDFSKKNHAPYIQNVVGGQENLFANIESRAKIEGQVVAAISLEDIKLEDLIEWANGLSEKGFVLAPLSAVAEGRAKK